MDDILTEFYEPQHIETCKLAGMLTVNQQNYETWSFDTKYKDYRVRIITEDKSVLRPDYITMKEHEIKPYLEGRLNDWLISAVDVAEKKFRFSTALDTLNNTCTTMTQVLFYWPTLASLFTDTNSSIGKRIAKAAKSSPSQRPALNPDTKQALRDITAIINAARLMPDEVPRRPVTVMINI
jgi:hypothetical protein